MNTALPNASVYRAAMSAVPCRIEVHENNSTQTI